MKGHVYSKNTKDKHSHYIILETGKDDKGKRKQKWIPFHGTKREAERELVRLLNDLHNGLLTDPAKMTVADLLNRWLKDCAKQTVSPTTYQRYAGITRDHLKPAFGHIPLAKLRPLQLQKAYTDWQQEGAKKKGKGGLSARTVLQHHRILHEALDQAVKWQLIPRNPADAVETPKPSRKEMNHLDEEGTIKLLNAAEGDRLYIPVLLAVTTGMRRGEVLGLRWSDTDFDDGIAYVRQSLMQTKDTIAFKAPKTAGSARAVPLLRMTIAALKRHRRAQAEEKLLFGPDYADNDLVCALPDGAPWPPDALSSSFRYLVKRAGMPGVRFHDLRHSHATQLMKEGVNPKIVSERLGHSSIAITLDLYSHVSRGLQQEAVDKLDASLQKAMDKPTQKSG